MELTKALFLPADFIVLDSPFEGMDEVMKKRVIDYLLEIKGSRPLLIAQEKGDDLDFAKKILL